MNSIVVFGSALHSKTPNDIDIACEHPLSEEDVKCIRDWAAQQHFVGEPAIDAHPIIQKENGELTFNFPEPCGQLQYYLTLQGDVTIRRTEYWSIPAILRAFPDDVGGALLAFEKLKHGFHDWSGEFKSLFGIMIDIGGHVGANSEDWNNYIVGLLALRSGIAKSFIWPHLKQYLPYWEILNQLALKGASEQGKLWAMRGSSGAGGRLLFGNEGVSTQYGKEVIPYERAAEFFVKS